MLSIPFCRSPCGERGLKLPVSAGSASGTRRSPCGERGLKFFVRVTEVETVDGRSPCGERGLKSTHPTTFCRRLPSLPVRGAWIEILMVSNVQLLMICRSPCGERGLKCRTCR